MFGVIGDVLTSGGIGAITGLIGGWLTKRENRKVMELKFNHEKNMAEIRKEELVLEHTQALAMLDKEGEIAEIEGSLEVEKRETDAFVESIKNQGKQSGIWLVDLVRGLMRPILTVALLWVTWEIYTSLDELVGGLKALPQDEVVELYQLVIRQIIFLAVTATAWWYASRGDKALK